MARYGAPLLTDVIRGKIGGVVFTKGRSGPTLRVRVRPNQPNTVAQTAVRAALTNAARNFKNLGASDAAAWELYASGLSLPNGVGGQFTPSGINAYMKLSAKFLAIDPSGTPPTSPPATAFAGDDITITAAGAADKITVTSSGANGANIDTEILLAPLPSANRKARESDYRINQYHHYASGTGLDIPLANGYYSVAYRFVLTTTGEAGPITVIGTFQVT